MIYDNESKFFELISQIPNIAVQGYNKNREVIYWNKASELIYGYSFEEAIGKKLEDLIIPNFMRNDIISFHANWCNNGVVIPPSALPLQKKDGSTVHVYSSHIMLGEHSDSPEMFCLDIDMSKQKEQESKLQGIKDELEHLANYDSLTDLPNRVLFKDRLEQAIKSARRHHSNIAILFIDLDNFKEINDSLGHHIGDKILIKVSKRIKNKIRDSDTFARLGGDEFTVILNNVQSVDDVSVFINNIMKLFKKPFIVENNTLNTTISIGVTIYPNDGIDASTLLKNSDAAMYEAKRSGRNTYSFYDKEMTDKVLQRVLLKTSLKKALEENELLVYYQAQINAKNNTLVGMEALVRWNHPTLGLITPNDFIPLAESTGMIVELDRIVMRKALSQVNLWNKQKLKPERISINLAIKQLEKDDFISFLKDLLNNENYSYEDIEFEISESQIMKNPDKSIRVLKEISDLGISIAIDDFGTGYSSLAYLRKLPINKLKIDKIFIDNVPKNTEDSEICKTIISLCKSLKLEVIAEGVESKEQKDFLLKNGCNLIQGYLYAKPMQDTEMTAFLKHKKKIK